ncbi:DUF2177 family protein [Dongia sp.]|uniref:DUF2177 family protein n=1 Tax=Dongia sp. TaxID=1977262 RepID=UPI0037506690
MKPFLLTYLVSGLSFLALDAVWLGVMGTTLYRAQLGNLVLEKFLLAPAVAFYLLYPVGIAVFTVGPALQAASGLVALGYGLLFGFLAYSTYNLTNLATLRGWSPLVTAVDIGWGSVATGAAAFAGFWILRLLGKG